MSSSSSKETTYKQVNMCLHTCTYTITHIDSAVHAVPKLFAKYGSNYRTNSGSQSASVRGLAQRRSGVIYGRSKQNGLTMQINFSFFYVRQQNKHLNNSWFPECIS